MQMGKWKACQPKQLPGSSLQHSGAQHRRGQHGSARTARHGTARRTGQHSTPSPCGCCLHGQLAEWLQHSPDQSWCVSFRIG